MSNQRGKSFPLEFEFDEKNNLTSVKLDTINSISLGVTNSRTVSKPCCNNKSADYTGKNRIVIKIDECLKLFCECGSLQRVLKGTKISGVVHLSDDYMILTMNDVDNKNPLYSLNVSDN